MEYEEFNARARAVGLQGEVSPSNLQSTTKHIRAVLDAEAKRDGPTSEAAGYVTVAARLQRLCDAGVPVCIGAGNDGNKTFNLLGALVPDLIVVGGRDGSKPAAKSSVSSLNDTYEPYTTELTVSGGRILTVSGTSYSTALATAHVADLRHRGFSVAKINELCRVRTEESQRAQPTRIIPEDLRDLAGFCESQRVATSDEFLANVRTLQLVGALSKSQERFLSWLSKQEAAGRVQSLNFILNVAAASDRVALSVEEVRKLLDGFAKCTSERRLAITRQLATRPSELGSVDAVLAALERR
jgi:hypothetical protein